MKRDTTTGRSRGEPEVIAPAVLEVRKRDLRLDGVDVEHATDRYSGFTLGRLMLRGRDADKKHLSDPGSINVSQFDAGEAWARIVHQHAIIMGYKLNIATPSVLLVGAGASCKQEPDEDRVIRIRRQWSDCYNSLMGACRDHGLRVRDVTYGVVVENWPLRRLSEADYGLLRIGLNSLAKVLR